jgi:hypothetical protein
VKADSQRTGTDADVSRTDLVGLIQLTTAIRIPQRGRPTSSRDDEEEEGGLSYSTMELISATIKNIFETSQFEVHPLTAAQREGYPDWVPRQSAHTWLGTRSRHVAIELLPCFYDPRQPLPPALDFHPDGFQAEPDSNPPWISYKRFQAARDRPRDTHTGCIEQQYLDATDYMVRQRGVSENDCSTPENISQSKLESIQCFLAELYAQRKADNLAARLSERIYHVWFPPGSLTPRPEHELTLRKCIGTLGFLPFVTFVRRPREEVFRRTVSVSIILIPLNDSLDVGRRTFLAEEIHTLLQVIFSPATQSFNREAAQLPSALKYRLHGPLRDYLLGLKSEHKDTRPLLCDIVSGEFPQVRASGSNESRNAPEASVRQWMELSITAGTERGITEGNSPWRGRELADGILSAIRMNGTWLVSVLHEQIPPVSAWIEYFDGGLGPDPRQLPYDVTRLLDQLAMQPRAFNRVMPRLQTVFPVRLFNRINTAQTLDNTLTWRIPARNGIVLTFPRTAESFPGASSLNSFGFLGHMVIAVSSSMDMMDALLREAAGQPDTLRRSSVAHELLIELEEMFDLDIASINYRLMWRRLLETFGLDSYYRLILERMELLGRYAETEEREEGQRFESTVAYGVAVLTLVLLLLSIEAPFTSHFRWWWRVAIDGANVGVVATLMVFRRKILSFYRRRVRRYT